MKSGLLALAVGTFALGIAEFGMMGILSDVAKGVGVSVVDAGHFISAYSLGVAVGAPLLVIFRRWPLKRVMLMLAGCIFLGNLMASVSPDYSVLLVSRFISGLPHGAFFGAGAIVCSRLVSAGHGAQAVAVMVGGMTVANVVGVPLATMVGNIFSWRMAFGGIAFIGLLSVLLIRRWVPYIEPLPDTGLKGQFHFLSSTAPWLIFIGVFFGQASVYCWLSYVEPMMTQITGFSSSSMVWVMALAGLGMVIGNFLAGKLSDRNPASLVTAIIATGLIVIMPLIYFCAHLKLPSLILMFIATSGLFGIGGPLQYLIVKYAKGGEMLGGASIQIAFNVSNAVSASVGGMFISAGYGLASPALAGVPFAVIGATALFVFYHNYHD